MVRISPDNDWLVTGSVDKTARLWPLQGNKLIDSVHGVAGRNLTV